MRKIQKILDQDGTPTIVEVKRSCDTRIRREVVGQMLDYAANAVVYWSADSIRSQFEESCRKHGQVADDAVAEFLADKAINAQEFWDKVGTNLQTGRLRLLLIADIIPADVLLNSSMNR